MITINGTDLATLGFTAHRRSLPALGGERTQVVPIAGASGGVRTGGTVEPATIRVEGWLRAASHADAALRADQLTALLAGEQRIRLADHPDREWIGWLQDASGLDFLAPQWRARYATVRLEWLLPDPRAVATLETTRTGPGALTLGTAPSELRIEASARAALTVRVRAGGASGRVLRELVWAGPASGALVVDASTQTVTRGGVNAIDGITAATTFPVADPAEGADYIEVPSGVVVRYRRRWR